MINLDLHRALFAEMRASLVQERPYLDTVLPHRVPAVRNHAFKSTKGMCRYPNPRKGLVGYQIDYSVTLFALATEEANRNTMVHEICHAFNHSMGGKGHDRGWKRLMFRFTGSAERCYTASEKVFGANADLVRQAAAARRTGRRSRYRAECGCICGPIQASRMRKGTAVYRCRHGKLTQDTILTEIK